MPGTDGQKMSKSYGNTIEIFAEGKPLKKTVMGIMTDSTPVEAPKDPDKCNVFALYSLFATEEEKAGAGGALPGRRHGLRRGQEDAAGEDQRLLRAHAARSASSSRRIRLTSRRCCGVVRPGRGAKRADHGAGTRGGGDAECSGRVRNEKQEAGNEENLTPDS